MSSSNRRLLNYAIRYRPLWIPAILVLLVYIPVSGNGFVWDDHKAFLLYPYYQQLSFLGRAFTEPLVFLQDYYRPLTSASYILQIHLLGLNPGHLHIASVLIHLLNICLVALLAMKLTNEPGASENQVAIPLAASLFYGLHPALIEAVSWISVRYDLLATFFMLLALLADKSIVHRLYRPLVVGFLFLLAALSKEMAVALALAMPFLHLAYRKASVSSPIRMLSEMRRRGDTDVYLSIFLFGLLYLLIRYHALGHLVSGGNNESITGGSSLSHLLLVFRSFAEYLSLIVLPFHQLGPAHPVSLPLEAGSVINWTMAALIIALPFASLVLVRNGIHSGWLALALLASLLPISNIAIIVRPAGSFFAESYLVFPIAIASLLLASVLMNIIRSPLPRRRPIIKTAGVAAGFLWLATSMLTIHTTIPLWKDDVALWKWASSRYPESTTALNNLASELNTQGQYLEAAKIAREALEINDRLPTVWATLGTAQAGQGEYLAAEKSFEQSIGILYENPETWVAIANVKAKQGNFREAITLLEQVVLPNAPRHLGAITALANIYRESGNPVEARKRYQEALALTALPTARQQLQKQIDALGPGRVDEHK